MKHKIIRQIYILFESFIRNTSGLIGIKLRGWYYSRRFGRCGKNLRISEGVIIENPSYIYLGDNVWIDKYSILMAGKLNISQNYLDKKDNKNFIYKEGELHIANNVHIAPQCIIQAYGGIDIGDNFTASAGSKIYSLSNDTRKCKKGTQFHKNIYYILSPISIEENVWLGINSTVLGGNIEKNTFISPNSIVWKNIRENSVVAGSPAKKIKNRF
jgi:acetyltransferase-like isoleucine patch superfamily enzyme